MSSFLTIRRTMLTRSMRCLTDMHEKGMISGEERGNAAWIEVRGRGRTNLRPFVGLIHNYIESSWVVIRGCSYLKKIPKPERDFGKKMQQLNGEDVQ